MGTDERNLQEYLRLWDKFEYLLKESGKSLSQFAENYSKISNEKDYDFVEYKTEPDKDKLNEKLKKQKQRKTKLSRVNHKTIKDIKNYIVFLGDDPNDGTIAFEAFDDEKFGNINFD